MPAGLPAKSWPRQSPPVESKNDFIWAAIMPNLVGKPKMMPSASASSLGVMIGTSLFGGAPIFPRTSSGSVSGTCFSGNRNLFLSNTDFNLFRAFLVCDSVLPIHNDAGLLYYSCIMLVNYRFFQIFFMYFWFLPMFIYVELCCLLQLILCYFCIIPDNLATRTWNSLTSTPSTEEAPFSISWANFATCPYME